MITCKAHIVVPVSTTALCLLVVTSLLVVACDSRPLPAQGTDHGLGGSADGGADRSVPLPPPPLPPPTCSPGDDPLLAISLAREGKEVMAHISNIGCTAAYRWQGCCGEGEPLVETLIGGQWKSALCAGEPKMCCDAEPSCVPLLPGESIAVRMNGLSADLCCGTTFRVTLPYSREPGCIEDASKIALAATSNALKLRDTDTCGTPCGSTLSCKTASEVCVIDQGWAESATCKPVPAGCDASRDCACMGASLCDQGFNVCRDVNTPNTIYCECPNC